jgi:hypothetical protein
MNADPRIEAARSIKIEDECSRRGIRLKRQGANERVGPCPRCGGTDRFAVNVTKRVWRCRQCQPRGGDILDFIQWIDACDFRKAIETLAGDRPRQATVRRTPEPRARTSEEYEQQQHRKAQWIWAQRRPLIGSIAEKYLRQARGITCALPPTLAFLPAREKYPPAMIAAYAFVDEPEPDVLGEPRKVDAVHLTRILPDGSDREPGKGAKITIGRPLGRPIVIAPANDLLGLAITEGIEDALTAHAATGLGAWAAGSAPFMPSLAAAVPDYIEAITVFGHPDEAGQVNANKLAEALERRGIEIRVEGIPT